MSSGGPPETEAAKLKPAVYEYLGKGEFAAAIRLVEEGLSKVSAAGDRKGEAAVQDLASSVQAAAGQYEEAAIAARKAVNVFVDLGDLEAAGHSLQGLCEACIAGGRPEQALQEAESLRNECRRAGDKPGEALTLQAACLAYYDQWQLEECLAAVREAATLFERAGKPIGQAQALSTLAELRLTMGGGYDTARRAAQKAKRLFKQAGPEYEYEGLRAQLSECQAHIYALIERPVHVHTAAAWADALKSAEEAEDLARGFGDLGLAASALCMAAEVHQANDRHQAAIRTARAAAELYKDHGGPQEVARALMLGADCAVSAKRKKDAKQLATEVLEIARQAGDEGMEEAAQAILDGVGEIEQDGGQPAAGQEKESSTFGMQTDPSAPPPSLDNVIREVMGLEALGGTLDETPVMQPGATGPLRPFSHDAFLALGRQNRQARAVLSMMKHYDTETAHVRFARPPPDEAETLGQRGASDGATWVAPVRKRLQSGVHWRPPNSHQGVRFGSIQKRH